MPNITINNVRISYPKLFTASQVQGQGELKFSGAFLIAETDPQLRALFDLANQVTAAKYPTGQKPHGFKPLPCYKAAENPKYAGNPDYEGMWVLNSSKNASQGAPAVVDQNMNKVLDPSAIYPGMYVNVALSVYCYGDKPGSMSKGVTTGLEAVQIVRDGDRLDNRPAVGELFKPIDVQDGPAPAAAGAFNPLG